VVEEETSNGFHVFELHMPTMGANVVLIIVVILAFASCWRLKLCRSLFRRRGSRRPSATHHSQFELRPVPPPPPPPPAAATPSSPASPAPAPDYWSPTIALLAENFVRAMGAAQVTYEDDPRPRPSARRNRPPRSPVFHDCRRFEEIRRHEETPKAEDKAVETPRTFSFSMDEA
jgi:hypothetical protein